MDKNDQQKLCVTKIIRTRHYFVRYTSPSVVLIYLRNKNINFPLLQFTLIVVRSLESNQLDLGFPVNSHLTLTAHNLKNMSRTT